MPADPFDGKPLRYRRLAKGYMIYSVDRDLKDTPMDVLGNKSPRRVIQLIGTEIVRNIMPNAWTTRLEMSVVALSNSLKNNSSAIRVAVSDVRFQNEADQIRSFPNGKICKISRPEIEAISSIKSGGHISESGISTSSSDIIVINSGAIDEYLNSASTALCLTKPHQIKKRMFRP